MDWNAFLNNQWVNLGISLLIVLAGVIIGRGLIKLLIGRVVIRLTKHTQTALDDFIIKAVRPPLYWLVIAISMDFAIQRLDLITEISKQRASDFFFFLYILLALVFAWRVVVSLFDWYGKEIAPRMESDVYMQIFPFLRRLVFILLAIVAAIIVLDYFNIEVSALVTTLGIGSLAIALAAQAALSDTISGFTIMLDRPFRIGDRIEIQELDTWGDVIDIGLRSSRIRTRDNRMVIVPNSLIAKSLIVNYSYPDTQYRIQIEIGVAYGTDIEHARKTIIDAVRGVEGVLADKDVEALFLQFGDSALIFRVRWWLESFVDTRRMFDKVNTAIYTALEEAGIDLPFPQQDVHFKIDPEVMGRIIREMRANNSL
ncbi:MAG: mechanosensitive ion channel [Anaerolineaceae bacterium]|nr:mechanosensitive ion channel [Anaerolineaceae bacterium]